MCLLVESLLTTVKTLKLKLLGKNTIGGPGAHVGENNKNSSNRAELVRGNTPRQRDKNN